MAQPILVVGSLNIDLVMGVERAPKSGESLRANTFETFIGGKGLNQAIAAARQGASVRIVGRIGADVFGSQLRAVVEREGIESRFLFTTPDTPTGVANILVDARAENTMLVYAGANGKVTPHDVHSASPHFQGAAVMLTQLEIPMETVRAAAEQARAMGVQVVLVPAPKRSVPIEILRLADIIIANREEISEALPQPTYDPELDARRMARLGVKTVIVTLGARGAFYLEDPEGPVITVAPYPIHAVDSTGAGDAFAGAFVAAIADKLPLAGAIQRAMAAGALACTVMGAEPSLPRKDAVDALLSKPFNPTPNPESS
ncbi:MAG: ribokinase [Anaerolineae bacterium]